MKCFKNSGGKIRILAKVMFITSIVIDVLVAILISVVFGLSIYNAGLEVNAAVIIVAVVIGILICALTIVSSWIQMLFIYAYGELVQNTNTLSRHFCDKTDNTEKTYEKIEYDNI